MAAVAVPPGTLINNQAQVDYTVGASNFNITSNVDTVTVVGLSDSANVTFAGNYPVNHPGDSLVMSVTIDNTSSNPLVSGSLVLDVPAGTTVTPVGAVTLSQAGNTVTATVPDLAISASTMLQFNLTLPLSATLGTSNLNYHYDANSATVTSSQYTLDLQPRTAAQASFMLMDAAGINMTIPVTQYKDGSGTFLDITPPLVSGSTTQLVTDAPLPLVRTQAFHKNNTMFVFVDDPDNNRDPAAVESVLVTINVTDIGGIVIDTEILRLSETGANTGVFIGYLVEQTAMQAARDGMLYATTSSQVNAVYSDNGGSGAAVHFSVLIDPYGMVLNSRTGQPIDGATVSMIDADSGLPATVYGDDGVSIYPSTVTSGGTVTDSSSQVYNLPAGGFRFPFAAPGNYRLVITLPGGSNYFWPSQTPTADIQSLPGGPFAIDVGSRGETFVLQPGPPLHLDIPLDPISSELFIVKSASKSQVATGDFLQYTLQVSNASNLTPVNDVTLTDILPHGFKYQKGSLRLDGAEVADPTIANDGRTMTIAMNDIAASGTASLKYVAQVATARPGEAVNSATATGSFGESSNNAKARVLVHEDLMRSRSLILGQVSAPSDEGEAHGIPGVRIYLEDGTYTVTDEKGLYHFEGVAPGTHVVQLDVTTLPQKFELTPPENDRFAGRSWSQFVDIQGGTMWRADFKVALKPKITGTAAVRLENMVDLDQSSIYYKLQLNSTHVPLRNVRLTVMLPEGARYVPGSTTVDGAQGPEPTVMDNMLVYRLGNKAADWNALLRFSTQLDNAAVGGASVTKALLTVDTPSQKDVRTAPVTVTLQTQDIETGSDHKHYVMRWQFNSMEATLNDAARQELGRLAQQIAGLKNIRVQVSGYSDSLPIRARSRHLFKNNTALSLARAEATASYLRDALGENIKAISVTGLGAKNPLASNTTEAGRALNRRVEIEIEAEQTILENRLIDGQKLDAVEEVPLVGLLPGEIWPDTNSAAQPSTPTDPAQQFDDKWLESASPGIEWVLPAADFLPAAPFTHIGVKHLPGQTVEVLINGAPVDKVHFEPTHVNTANTVAYSWWRGVGLKDGDNQLEVTVTDRDGKVISRMSRNIHYSRPPIKAELLVEQSVLNADGITPPRIAVRFTDRDGFPARKGTSGEFSVAAPYVAETGLPENYELLAGAAAARPRYVVGEDGIAFISLQPTTRAGEVRLTLPLMNGEHDITVALNPALRDWILVGFAEGTVGYNTLKGNTQPLDGSAGDEDLYQDGRVALFAKGRIKGDMLMTIAYDTAKQKNNNQVYQTIDPGTYYTVYGDRSVQRYDAPSAAKLYIKVEKDTFYALFGDYDTDMQSTRLFTYNRSLTGVKSRYKDDRYEVMVFGSESNQGFIKDEIRGQGISGPYRLSRGTIVLNSEKIRIQARDRFRSEIIVSEKTLSQHLDYDIDYVEGMVTFREPVQSVDSSLNPVFIVIDYESYDGQNFSLTYGGRGQAQIDDKTQVGITHINEGRVGGEARLDAVDGTYQINEQTQARLELAQSKTNDNATNETGNAFLAEINHRAPAADLKAYVSQYDQDFGVGQYNGSENGTRKVGAEGVYHANERTDVKGLAYRQDVLETDANRNVIEAETRYRPGSDTELHLGLQAAQDNLGNDQTQNSTLLTSGVNQKFLDKKLTVHLDRDQALGEAESVDFPSRTRVGADYLLTENTQVFAEQEYTDGKERDTQSTVMGLRTTPWEGSEAFTTVSQNQDGANDNTAAGMGLRQRLKLTERWSMDAGFEKSRTLSGGGTAPFNSNTPFASGTSNDFTASSLGLTYNPETWLWNMRGEYRDASNGDQWNLLTSAQTSVNNNLALLAALRLSDSNLTTGHLFDSSISLGLAYRPLDSRWLILNKLEYLQNRKEGNGDSYNNRRWVNNLNANYQATPQWQTSLQYGSKYVTDTFDGKTYSGYLDLTGVETRYDLNKSWDVGVHGSVLHAWNADQYDYGLGASLGYTLTTNMWISVGYNLLGFHEEDFSRASFTSQGPYLQVRMKFDQDSMKDLLKALH